MIFSIFPYFHEDFYSNLMNLSNFWLNFDILWNYSWILMIFSIFSTLKWEIWGFLLQLWWICPIFNWISTFLWNFDDFQPFFDIEMRNLRISTPTLMNLSNFCGIFHEILKIFDISKGIFTQILMNFSNLNLILTEFRFQLNSFSLYVQ